MRKNYQWQVWEAFQKEGIEEINLGEMLAADRDIIVFYYLPAGSADDIVQYKVIENLENVKTFSFHSDRHGHTMLSENIPMILAKSREQLEALYRKYQGEVIEPWEYLRGSSDSMNDFVLITVRRIRKRIIASVKHAGDIVQDILTKL